MHKYVTQSTKYYCQKAKAIVKTRSKTLILSSFITDGVANNFRVSFDCDQKFNCGINTESCKLISFNWRDCINPLCVHSIRYMK